MYDLTALLLRNCESFPLTGGVFSAVVILSRVTASCVCSSRKNKGIRPLLYHLIRLKVNPGFHQRCNKYLRYQLIQILALNLITTAEI